MTDYAALDHKDAMAAQQDGRLKDLLPFDTSGRSPELIAKKLTGFQSCVFIALEPGDMTKYEFILTRHHYRGADLILATRLSSNEPRATVWIHVDRAITPFAVEPLALGNQHCLAVLVWYFADLWYHLVKPPF